LKIFKPKAYHKHHKLSKNIVYIHFYENAINLKKLTAIIVFSLFNEHQNNRNLSVHKEKPHFGEMGLNCIA